MEILGNRAGKIFGKGIINVQALWYKSLEMEIRMRQIDANEITAAIKEMCIEANHYLSKDMKKVFDKAVNNEKSPLGKQVLNQLNENLDIAASDMIPICQDTGMAAVSYHI